MREKIFALVAVGAALPAGLLAHPGHGTSELGSKGWHWLLEPEHTGLTFAVVAITSGLLWWGRRLARNSSG